MVLDPKQIKIIQNYSTTFKIKFDLVGSTHVSRLSDFKKYQGSPIAKFRFFVETLGEANCFGPNKIIILFCPPQGSQNIDPKTTKKQQSHMSFYVL